MRCLNEGLSWWKDYIIPFAKDRAVARNHTWWLKRKLDEVDHVREGEGCSGHWIE